jgi:hypothetical protein
MVKQYRVCSFAVPTSVDKGKRENERNEDDTRKVDMPTTHSSRLTKLSRSRSKNWTNLVQANKKPHLEHPVEKLLVTKVKLPTDHSCKLDLGICMKC